MSTDVWAGGVCTMIGRWRQSDFDSIGGPRGTGPVGLGISATDGYDLSDEETGGMPRSTRRTSHRHGGRDEATRFG
jgi:hypothetical protein